MRDTSNMFNDTLTRLRQEFGETPFTSKTVDGMHYRWLVSRNEIRRAPLSVAIDQRHDSCRVWLFDPAMTGESACTWYDIVALSDLDQVVQTIRERRA